VAPEQHITLYCWIPLAHKAHLDHVTVYIFGGGTGSNDVEI